MTTTVKKTRPALKTGNPQTDKAATNGTSAESHLKNFSYKSRQDKLAAHLIAIGAEPQDLENHDELLALHAKVCGAPQTEGDEDKAAIEAVQADHKASEQDEAETDTHDEDGNALESGPIMEVAGSSPQPKADKTPKAPAARRTAKQELARLMVLAMDKAAAEIAGNETIMAGMTPEQAYRAAAQWVHHLPVGDVWPGQTLPQPQRSDWAAKAAK